MDVLKSSSIKGAMPDGFSKSIKDELPKGDIGSEISKKSDNKEFSVKNLLDSLLKDLVTGSKSKETVLQMLKERNIQLSTKDTLLELKSIIISLKDTKVTKKTMDGLLLNMEKLDGKSLEAQIRQSGIFLESKLANQDNSKNILSVKNTQNPKEEIAKDIKANLLQIRDELGKSSDTIAKDIVPKIDRVLTNISYYQLLSYSMGTTILYLPLLWDGLEEGKVSIKKLKQKRFFCEINLKLKDFGEIDLLVMLFDDIHVNISIFTQNSEFLNRIRENLKLLRRGISALSLIPSNIYLYDSLKNNRVKKEAREYAQSMQIGVGISIHV